VPEPIRGLALIALDHVARSISVKNAGKRVEGSDPHEWEAVLDRATLGKLAAGALHVLDSLPALVVMGASVSFRNAEQ